LHAITNASYVFWKLLPMQANTLAS
jgi:hypothetical protein